MPDELRREEDAIDEAVYERDGAEDHGGCAQGNLPIAKANTLMLAVRRVEEADKTTG